MAGIRNVSRELLAAFSIEHGGGRAAARVLGMNRASYLRALGGKGSLSAANVEKVSKAFAQAPAGLKGRYADIERAVYDRRIVGRESVADYAKRLAAAPKSDVEAELSASRETRRRAKAGIPPAIELPDLPESKRNRSPLKPEQEISEYLSEQGIVDYEARNRADLRDIQKTIQENGENAIVILPGGSGRAEAWIDGQRVGTYKSYGDALDSLVEGLYSQDEYDTGEPEDLPF